MILISIFRLLMIFPFIIYFLLILNGLGKKQARIMVAPLYFISCGFITKYLFETEIVVLILVIFVIITAIIAIIKLRQHYKIFNVFQIFREWLSTFSLIYPIIYVFLIIYGVGKIFITMR